jgi:N-acetylglutamate synthase/N-acetylornithine aminotransferase
VKVRERTDTFPKLLSRTFTLPSSPDRSYRLAGMTKGAGMSVQSTPSRVAMFGWIMPAPLVMPARR